MVSKEHVRHGPPLRMVVSEGEEEFKKMKEFTNFEDSWIGQSKEERKKINKSLRKGVRQWNLEQRVRGECSF